MANNIKIRFISTKQLTAKNEMKFSRLASAIHHRERTRNSTRLHLKKKKTFHHLLPILHEPISFIPIRFTTIFYFKKQNPNKAAEFALGLCLAIIAWAFIGYINYFRCLSFTGCSLSIDSAAWFNSVEQRQKIVNASQDMELRFSFCFQSRVQPYRFTHSFDGWTCGHTSGNNKQANKLIYWIPYAYFTRGEWRYSSNAHLR